MVAHGQPAGGRSRGDFEGGGKAKSNWSYWVCSSRLCREWNWCSLWQCRSCGRVAPPWVKAAQPPAAAAGLEQPAADAEGFVVQPRGRKAKRQAKRAAARAASAGAAGLAGASEASSRQLSEVERHRQEVKRIEDFLAALGGSIDDACLQSLRAALDRERRRLAEAGAAQADRRKADPPLPKALYGAGNALGKMVRQGRAKEQALLKAEEAHAAAINERHEAVAREAACAEAVEECRAALEAHREEQKAAEARQAQEVGAAFAGTDLLGLVFGLIQQVEALPQGFAAGSGEAAIAEVAEQIAAVRRQAPPEPKGRSSWADTPVDVSDEDLDGDDEELTRASSVPSVQAAGERVAESLDGFSEAVVPSGQRTRMTAQEACIGKARFGPPPAPGSGPVSQCPLRAGLEVMGRIGNVGHRSVEVIEAFFHAHQSWPQLVLLRDTRLTQGRRLGARATARRLGYTAFLHEAVATEQSGPNATSGGVAIQVGVGLQAEELGWPAGVRGQVLGPSEATCCAQGQERVFDWFFESSDLASCAASCTTTLSDFGLRPHSLVPPRLQGVRCVALVEAFAFGKRGKVAQKEVTWSTAQGSGPIALSAAFGEWIEAAEGALSGIHVTATDDLPRFLGRAAWPMFRRAPFSALVLRGAWLKCSMLARRLRSCLAVALQRVRAEQASRWHPNHSWWYVQEAAAMAKPPDEATQVIDADAGRPLVGMGAASQPTRALLRLWLQEGFSRRGGAHRWDVGSSTLPPITLGDLQQACRRFGPYVGSGCVYLLPRQLLLQPEALPLRWSDFLVAFEDEPSSFRGRQPCYARWGPDHRCPLFWGRDGRGSVCSLMRQQESRAAPWLQVLQSAAQAKRPPHRPRSPRRLAWLDAHGLDEESLLGWAEGAAEAVSSARAILDP
ncbi:unnamed protein product [Prorocentrum cordatum]|uniref:RanBP2-type domain-containing protein n=1 Tax=Prorocentrum cordatum TaxID=2364126 RepID=A0ABN9W772_9DINO|nr:unnamed protein product [Polarella glacialis]